jgi:hypothetical protein
MEYILDISHCTLKLPSPSYFVSVNFYIIPIHPARIPIKLLFSIFLAPKIWIHYL